MALILLRPLWLLALLPWLWQGWHRRKAAPLLSPAMAAYLLPNQGRPLPWRWLACLPIILALCGPALRQQSQPVAAPALDIWLLDLSRAMLATDLLPDRATRMRLLLQEMLAEAGERPIALILFAGDAYLAIPATQDHRALALLLPDLRPAIMPLLPAQAGSAPERAVALALTQIPPGQRARLLLVTGGLSPTQIDKIAERWPCRDSLFCHTQTAPRLDILLINAGEATPLAGTASLTDARDGPLPAPEAAAMARLAARLGGELQWLRRGIPHFAPLPTTQAQAAQQPRDLGPWLLISLLPLALLARIGTVWLILLVSGAGLISPPPLQANPAIRSPMTDQQAWQAYQQGHYLAAAKAFQDPVWQGNAWYRAGDYARAAAAYGRGASATAHYNRGNALVQLGDLAGARQAYLAALALEPTHEDARHNLALLQALPPQATPKAQPSRSATPPKSSTPPAPGAAPDDPLPPAPPVLLLEQRLRKQAERRLAPREGDPW